MTTHWCDFQNADVVMNMGSNSVENHPLSSRWIHRAHEKGATWIVVDPRYTRTAEMADIYCPIRSGTDIAFYGGLFKYIIDHELWQHEYVVNYTNASYLLDPAFDFDPATGLYSGWDADAKTYDNSSWHYQVEAEEEWDTSDGGAYAWVKKPGVPDFTPPKKEHIKKDPTLSDPMCVFQQLKKHYDRYDMDTVCNICGMDRDILEKTYAAFASTGEPGKAGVILYALGQTQHTYGGQNIRSMAILQLLLGNVGVPGGGVAALRGEPNVQGATDMGIMVDEHPAYLKWANTTDRKSLRAWLESQTYNDGYYANKPKFIVSSLKEWFGKNATKDNDYGYDWWPKVPSKPGSQDYTYISTFELMKQHKIRGYFNWGMNPAHSAPNTNNVVEAVNSLDWYVCVDWKPTETALSWKAPGVDSSKVNTEAYFLPAALIYEKPGIIINSGRWLQYRYQAVEPWDEAKPDYWIVDAIFTAVRDLYDKEGGANPDPILKAKWDYYVDGKIDPRPVAWAFNGYYTDGADFSKPETVKLLKGYSELGADGSTACPMWIYSGSWNNQDAMLDPSQQPLGRRSNEDKSGLGLYSDWAFSWPSNRRILYNRASSDMDGKPWNPDKKLNEWNGSSWEQVDVADFVVKDAKDNPVPPDNKAFMMVWEQNARLESYAMVDGPLPEHFEPFETPVQENLLNGSLNNPMLRFSGYESTKHGDVADYPIVATTYSVTEHWQSGTQSRSCPALVEAMPRQFVEISEELAAEKGIKQGDKVRVWNNRGSIIMDSVITKRIKPLMVNGHEQHLIGMTHHYGWAGIFGTSQYATNELTPNVGDPNTSIPEYKAFLVNIEKA